ncbi:MAG: regulatory protein RecX [Janthinobacterium lividum]
MRGDAEVAADASVGAAEVDQVSAAREWLRQHGVEPGDVSRAVGEDLRSAAPVEGGYDRSRRASGPVGRSGFGRRTRGRRTDPDGDIGSGPDDDGAGAKSPDADADPEEVARGIVLRKLAVQARTRVELERALQGRDVPEEAAATVLDRMTEVGLVDDVTFAHDWVASRQQRRHLSKTALRRELQTKGVDRDLIDDALAGVAGVDEHQAALDLASRRAATMAGLTREVAYRRLGGVLARRGFSASITSRVLAEVLGDSFSDSSADD